MNKCIEYCIKVNGYNCCYFCDKPFCNEQCKEFQAGIKYENCPNKEKPHDF
jgi:hypothetical protein